MREPRGPILPRSSRCRAGVTSRTSASCRPASNSSPEEGPDALTVGSVAPRAGLGTVYRRFGNKERLLAALQFAFIQIVDADIEWHVHRNGRIPTSDAERVQVGIEAPLRWTWRIAWCTPPARIG